MQYVHVPIGNEIVSGVSSRPNVHFFEALKSKTSHSPLSPDKLSPSSFSRQFALRGLSEFSTLMHVASYYAPHPIALRPTRLAASILRPAKYVLSAIYMQVLLFERVITSAYTSTTSHIHGVSALNFDKKTHFPSMFQAVALISESTLPDSRSSLR